MADAVDLIRRWERLKADRQPWESRWEELALYMHPRRLGFTSERTQGDARTDDMYDGTAMRAARGLANAVAQMTRPEGEQWFFIRAVDDAVNEDDEARAWFADAERRMLAAIFNPAARFRQATGEADADLVVFGTAAVFTGRSRALDHLFYRTLHLNEVVIGQDDEGTVDTLFRERKMTLRQAAMQFDEKSLSDAARRRMEKNPDERETFLQAVVPNRDAKPAALFSRDMPVAGSWMELSTKHVVSRTGFQEFPFAVPRWDTSSGEVYGRSPGMIALPDAATSQAMGETILVAGQRAAAPPLFAPNDGSFSTVNTFPDGISYYDVETAKDVGGNPFFALDTRMNLPITRDMQSDVRDQIQQAFFRNVFNLPLDRPNMTATEVIERKQEFIREIGPVFGRLETDYLAPIIERTFRIMLRAGSFGQPPEVLAGANVEFEYASPVTKIKEQAEAQAAFLWAAGALQMAAGGKPEALDLIDADELLRFQARAANLPPRIVATRETVEALRQQRAEAQQAAQEMAMMQQGAEIAGTAAGAAETGLRVIQGGAA